MQDTLCCDDFSWFIKVDNNNFNQLCKSMNKCRDWGIQQDKNEIAGGGLQKEVQECELDHM